MLKLTNEYISLFSILFRSVTVIIYLLFIYLLGLVLNLRLRCCLKKW